MADIERALSTSVGTTGAYLLPEVVDPVIRDYVTKATPVLSVVTRVNWPTQTYWIRKRTALPTAAFSTDGGSLPAASDSTYAKVSKTVKYLYTRGEVTGPLIAAAGGVVSIRRSARSFRTPVAAVAGHRPCDRPDAGSLAQDRTPRGQGDADGADLPGTATVP